MVEYLQYMPGFTLLGRPVRTDAASRLPIICPRPVQQELAGESGGDGEADSESAGNLGRHAGNIDHEGLSSHNSIALSSSHLCGLFELKHDSSKLLLGSCCGGCSGDIRICRAAMLAPACK